MNNGLQSKTLSGRLLKSIIVPLTFIGCLFGQTPTITSFSPTNGGIGSEVTITGTNFSTTPSANIVWFGGVQAVVTAATSTSLTTVVPIGAQYGPITVLSNSLIARSSQFFNVSFTSSSSLSIAFDSYLDQNTVRVMDVELADLDDDGKLDIIATDDGDRKLLIHRNTSANGVMSFATLQEFDLPTWWGLAEVGDINGDGKLDVVISNYDVNSISVFRNTSTVGTISFAARTDIALGITAHQIALDDLDGDGKLDIVCGVSSYNPAYFKILQNQSSGDNISFATAQNITVPNYYGETNVIGVCDLNGDGKSDIVTNGNDVYPYYGDGGTILRNTTSGGTISFTADTTFIHCQDGYAPYGVEFSDCDSDGKPDVVIRSRFKVEILLNTSVNGGEITYNGRYSYDQNDVGGVAIADFNGNNAIDLVAAVSYGNSKLYTNNSSGPGNINFNNAQNLYQAGCLTTGDINLDGLPDVLMGTGSSFLYNPNSAPIPEFSASIASHNFNDILVGNIVTQAVTVTNPGSVALTIGSITSNLADFTISPTTGSIPAGDSTVFTISFTPTTAGAQSGSIIFHHDAPIYQDTLAVSGTGVFSAQSGAGNMFTLNGSSQYLEADIVTSAVDNVTMEAWVNWDGQSGGSPGIIYQGASGGSGYGILLYNGATPARAFTILCGGKGYVTSATELPTGGWHHVAAVRASGTWKLYLDGIEQPLTNATTVVPNTPAGACNIGSVSSGTQPFKGKIDEVRIWDVARSKSEIQNSYASLVGNETGLAAYWRMDEGSGSTTGDGSGHSKTATIYGSATCGSSTAPITTPGFSASPTSYDFGDVLVGESAQHDVTISNTGGGILHLSSITTPGSDFTISPTSADILSGSNKIFTVTFTPTSATPQSGNLSFTDNAGNHTVVISGTGLFEAQANAGSSVSFDGIDDYIQTNLNAQPTAMATATWEAWIKPERLNYSAFQGILTTDDGGWDRGIWILENTDQLIVGYGTNGFNPGVSLTLDTWYHIAIVYKTDNVLLYINGVEYSLNQAPEGQNTIYNLRIGSDYVSRGFQGEIDEVRIWNDERSKTEIQANYRSIVGDEDNLVAYWRFDENSGTTAGDATGHGYTGTLVNSPTWVSSSGAAVSAPVFSASPSSHDFGDVLIGEIAQQNITISNTGGGVLNISPVSTPGTAYSVSPSSANIASGDNQVFTLTFTPTTSGAQNGDLTFTDNIGNHTVSISGTGVFQSQAGAEYAVDMDGVDDYVEMTGVTAATTFTVEFWINPDSYPASGTSNYFLVKGNMTGQKSYFIEQYPGSFCVRVSPSGTAVNFGTVPINTWTHLAFTYDGTTLKSYTNGLLSNSAVLSVTPTVSPNTLVFGYNWYPSGSSYGSAWYNGQLDEVRVWDTARTQAQIQASFASLAGNEAGLSSYWRLDEGTGTTSGDATGGGITADLINGATWVTSTAGIAAPIYATSSGTVAFGNVAVDATSDETVTITNDGGGFLSISSAVSDNARFTVSPTSANIASGATQVFTVTFAPTTHGDQTGTLTLTHNPNGTTHTISLTGTGQQALFSTVTDTLAFGTVQVNIGSAQTLTVTNDGNIALAITEIVCDPAVYTISPTTATIAAGGNQVFNVTLTATVLGSVPGTITFTDNALNSPQSIAATATAVTLLGSGTSGDPYQIGYLNDLKTISENSSYWNKYFIQTADIDASATSTWNSSTGFSPIGIPGTGYFQGTYDGNYHTIDGLVISRSGTDYQGLFGATSGGAIKNLGVTNVNVTGREHTGGLVGNNNSSSAIENCYSTGTVNSTYNNVGGLAGSNTSASSIVRSFSSATTIATGTGWSAGGLVGYNNTGSISNSYASGTVTGINAVGGLVGNGTSGTVTNCFSYGAVSGTGSYIGGLIGGFSYQANNSFWDVTTSGQASSSGGTGKTTAEMQVKSLFTIAGWDFRGETTNGENDTWNMGNSRNSGYPYLDWQYPSDPVIELATVTTTAASEITTTTASSGGEVSSNVSGDAVTAYGICWSTSANPTTANSHTSDGTGAGTFSSSITGLTAGTTYHVRAYATNLAGTSYGDDISFTSLLAPTVTTQAVSDIASTSATGNGTITVLGVPNPTQHGMVWGTDANPAFTAEGSNWSEATPLRAPAIIKGGNVDQMGDTRTTVTSSTRATSNRTEEGEATSTGAFTSVMTGLLPNTTYHVRTYATNSVETAYGNDVTFTSLPSLATVTTQAVTDIAITTATGNGNITDLGVPNPTEHGVCWSTSTGPTVADDTTAHGAVSSTGAFTGALTGLTSNTTYYVRAYATNTAGTAYGNEINFTTLPTLATVTTQAVSDIAITTATGNGNVTDLGIPNPTQHGFCWSTSTGPTVANDTTANGSVSSTGAFTGTLTGLISYVTYYVRAYATNTAGTAYGDEVSFTTLPTLPTVTTQAVSDISITTATGNGNITNLGIPNPTQYGVCWGTTSGPTVADSKTEEGSATSTGAFTSSITGLSGLSTYYVRAYTTNTAGTVYGSEVSFSTSADEPTTQASEIVFSNPDKGTATISWTNGNGSKRAVFLKATNTGSSEPVDHTIYTANTAFGSGTQIGTTGWYCVYNGTGTTVDLTNLIQTSTYRAMVCEYNGAAGGENYSLSTATGNPANYTLPNFAEESGIAITQNSQSKAAWGDIDNDGDLDVVLAGMNGVELYENNGDKTFTRLSGHGIGNYYSSPLHWEDFDKDGYVDLLMTTGNYFIIYRNQHNKTFSQAVIIRTDQNYYQILAVTADYDRDTYPDILVVGSDGTYFTKLYKNNGDWTFTVQADLVFDQFRYGTAAWGDYNNDGYPDIFMTGTTASGYSAKLYKNVNGTSFEAQTDGMPWIPIQQGSAAWSDYNNDGYLDLMVTGYNFVNGVGYVPGKLYKNNGDNTFTDQSAITLPALSYASIAWGDYNSDGLADLVVNGRTNDWTLEADLFKNNGDNTFTQVTDSQLPGAYKGSCTWNDYDNDGDLDLLVTGDVTTSSYTGIDKLYENIGGSPNTVPAAPTNLQVTLSDKVTFSWNQATDSETAAAGLTYNLYIGSTDSTSDILTPSANIQTGKRYVVKPGNSGHGNSITIHTLPGGNLYWGVQAIDAAYAGGPFAAGGSFSNIGPATQINFCDHLIDRMTVNWTNGTNGANRMVFMKEGLTESPVPVNGTDYTANAAFTQGSQIGSSGWYCVYAGSGSSVTVTNVNPTTTYRVAVVEYAGDNAGRYYISRAAPGNPRNRFPVIVGSGNALVFDGTDDYISATPDVPDGSDTFTVEAWVRIDQTETRYITGWGLNSNGDNTFTFRISNTQIGCDYGYGSWFPSMPSIAGKWTHVAYTFDGSRMSFYVNGTTVYSNTTSPSAYVGHDHFFIGTKYFRSALTSFFDGEMDELRIWDVARTQTELAANMCHKLTPANESHLVAYYDFDSAIPSDMLYDRSNPDNDGTLQNFDVNTAWTKSGAPVGNLAMCLNSTTPTCVGGTGQSCMVTITSTPGASNFLNLYTATTGFGAITEPDVGSWPTAVVKRADIIWGVHQIGTVTADLVFDYSSIAGISSPDQLHLLKRPDGCSEWLDVTADYVHDMVNRTLTRSGNTSFSEFTLGTETGDNSLPVSLSKFTAENAGGGVLLQWTTESEIENLGFILERQAVNDSVWTLVTDYQDNPDLAGNGSTNESHDYRYHDKRVRTGITYSYRLSDVDYQGHVKQHPAIEITVVSGGELELPTEFALNQNYPNPFNPSTTIRYALPEMTDVRLVIYDLQGREVRQWVSHTQNPGWYQIVWDGTSQYGRPLSAGIYFMRIQAGQFVQTRKMLLLK